MLRELHISNLAIIADARIELHPGLNCFTGATGAGKSLVIGAIEVLLGLRSPAEMLRPGMDEGRISGVFEVADADTLRRIEAATDVKMSDAGGELLLTRRLFASGRSSMTLNGHPITLTMLRALAELIIDVHGQHDHQYLLRSANQLDVLDQFGGLEPLRAAYHAVFTQLSEARRRITELASNQELRRQQLELYRFQADEIDAAELGEGEYEELTSRADVLQNLEKLKKDAGSVHSALYEADGSILERLKMAAAVLAELATLDGHLQPVAAALRDGTIQLEEASFDLSRYLDKLDLDPGELGEVHDRLNIVNRLLNKYGDSVEQTLQYRHEIGAKIDELSRAAEDLGSLEAQTKPLLRELKKLGQMLSEQRRSVADKLAPQIEKSLSELGMERARFSVNLVSMTGASDDVGAAATASGFDQVEFIAQTNPGQLAQPLRKIASGGEMSRIMLALKGILAQSDRVSVLVFDEIDSNVGGRLGAIIGSKLQALARHHQVLCISHLPQIASYADRHLTVRKEVVDGVTTTAVKEMTGSDRLEEIAEMIGGQRITDVTRKQAAELLDTAQNSAPVTKLMKEKSRAVPSSNGHPAPPAAASAPPARARRGIRSAGTSRSE